MKGKNTIPTEKIFLYWEPNSAATEANVYKFCVKNEENTKVRFLTSGEIYDINEIDDEACAVIALADDDKIYKRMFNNLYGLIHGTVFATRQKYYKPKELSGAVQGLACTNELTPAEWKKCEREFVKKQKIILKEKKLDEKQEYMNF